MSALFSWSQKLGTAYFLLQKLEPLDFYCKNVRRELYRYPLDEYTTTLFKSVAQWQLFTYNFGRRLNKSTPRDYESIGKIAVDYLLYSGYIVMGVHLLRLGRMDASKMKMVDHYFNAILPRTKAHLTTMKRWSPK